MLWRGYLIFIVENSNDCLKKGGKLGVSSIGGEKGQVCRGKHSDRISAFCFDSSHCSLWGLSVWVPFRRTIERHAGRATAPPLFFGDRECGTKPRSPLYCNGHYGYSPKWLVPRTYYAIYGRSLVVHTVFSGPRDCTRGHTFSEEKRVSSRCSSLSIFKFQRKIQISRWQRIEKSDFL